MASIPPPSRPSTAPAGVPSSNGKYIGLAIVLLGGVAALIGWKTCQKPAPVTVAVPDAAPPPVTTGPSDEDIPLPEEVEEAGPPESDAGKKVVAASTGCEARTCSGTMTPELTNALSFRARQARRCYESVLAQDPTLHGKLTLALKVGSTGQVCSVGVASNELGSSAVANCIVDRYRSAAFPAPKGGCIQANVPINLVSNQ